MKKITGLFSLAFFAVLLLFSATSCHRGSGCPATDTAHVQANKKGEFKKSKTRSGLFPKGVYKKSKK